MNSHMRSVVLLFVLASAACTSSNPVDRFSGTYRSNERESVLLPGEHIPAGFEYSIADDGVILHTIQSFTDPSGAPVKLQWRGECDGRDRPIEGAAPPGMQMSCIRAEGALLNKVSGQGWTYSERCVLPSPERLVCSGTMPDAQGTVHPFSYVLDRL
jgi:hypothetical protein